MDRSLRILFLASWYPNRNDLHLGNFVQRHAECISAKHEVFVVSAVAHPEPLKDRVQRGNLTEYTIYYRNELPFISYLWSMAKGIRMARKSAGKFDLCHVNVAWPAGFIALLLGLPYVVSEHFSGYLPQRKHKWNLATRLFTRMILKKAKMVVPVSEFLRNAMAEFAPGTRFTIIPNVVNEKLFKYQPPPREGRFTFLHLSTLENESKNISGMANALRMIVNRGRRDFRVQIGGDGDPSFLEKQLSSNSLSSERFPRLGAQEPHQVAELMANSHALLMFSHYETQSCTILEALCSGRPIVTTAVGGIPEITDETNSIQMEDDDRVGLAKSVEKMIDTYSRFNTAEIAEKARAKYSYEAVGKRYDEVYANALKKAPSDR